MRAPAVCCGRVMQQSPYFYMWVCLGCGRELPEKVRWVEIANA